jgi:hypothetical protein
MEKNERLENGANRRIIIQRVKISKRQPPHLQFRAAFKCNVLAAESQSKTGNLHFFALLMRITIPPSRLWRGAKNK